MVQYRLPQHFVQDRLCKFTAVQSLSYLSRLECDYLIGHTELAAVLAFRHNERQLTAQLLVRRSCSSNMRKWLYNDHDSVEVRAWLGD